MVGSPKTSPSSILVRLTHGGQWLFDHSALRPAETYAVWTRRRDVRGSRRFLCDVPAGHGRGADDNRHATIPAVGDDLHYQILKTYTLNDADWAEYQREKHSRVRSRTIVPSFVKVVGIDEGAGKTIEDFLTPLMGKPLNTDQLDGMLTRLTGVGRYESLTYDVVEENGRSELLVRVHEKSYAPPLLQPSFVIDGSQTDDVTFTMGGRLTFMDVAGYRSEWRTDFEFGETYGIQTQLFKPIKPLSRWFVELRQSVFLWPSGLPVQNIYASSICWQASVSDGLGRNRQNVRRSKCTSTFG